MTQQEIDRIFNDDYEPPWLIEQREIERQALNDAITTVIEYKWRLEAMESMERISAKYRNPPKRTLTA